MFKAAFTYITTPIIDIYHMFFTGDKGMSLRKGGFVFALYSAYKLQLSVVDDHIKQNIISSWMIFGSVCIGLITIPELIKVLNKGTPDPSTGDQPK